MTLHNGSEVYVNADQIRWVRPYTFGEPGYEAVKTMVECGGGTLYVREPIDEVMNLARTQFTYKRP